jgi:2-methylcitrate dehydratase PrpD
LLSKELALFIRNTQFSDLGEDIIEFTKLCILDWFGNAIKGRHETPVQLISDFVKEMGGNSQATPVTGEATSIVNAALINGAASHVIELDDIHKASIIHAATVVIPSAFSVAESQGKSGKDVLTAIAIGYDVCFRIGEAVTPSHYYYWHNTATCGTFGAAAAAAKLLDLNEEQIMHALGSAGTQAAGLWEFIEDGAMSKQLHTAKAAMNGVIAASLAKKDFTGASKILEGSRGFFAAMSDETINNEKIIDNLGDRFRIIENSFKIHASCRHTHSAIDVVLSLKQKHILTLEQIRSIRVKTYQTALDITDNDHPTSIYASKFSLQFCTALAFIKGNADLDSFNEITLRDEAIRSLMKRIYVSVDSETDNKYPEKWGAKVEIELQDGSILSEKTDYPKGDPENPVSEEQLIRKFKDLSQELSEAQQDRLINMITKIDELEDIKQVMTATLVSH